MYLRSLLSVDWKTFYRLFELFVNFFHFFPFHLPRFVLEPIHLFLFFCFSSCLFLFLSLSLLVSFSFCLFLFLSLYVFVASNVLMFNKTFAFPFCEIFYWNYLSSYKQIRSNLRNKEFKSSKVFHLFKTETHFHKFRKSIS